MTEMTGRERIGNMLRRKPMDRIPVYEHFWDDTQRAWTEAGKLKPGEDLATHFGFDISEWWTFNMVADLDFVPQVVEETATTVLTRDGNGALLRYWRLGVVDCDILPAARQQWNRQQPRSNRRANPRGHAPHRLA